VRHPSRQIHALRFLSWHFLSKRRRLMFREVVGTLHLVSPMS
jgi:hypothetical protein